MNLKEFAIHRFDTLVLLFVVVFISAIILFIGREPAYAGIEDWFMKGALGPSIGALLNALQQSRSGARSGDPSGASRTSVRSETITQVASQKDKP